MFRPSQARRRLDYYNEELQYLREMGELFAKEHPKMAGRLGLDAFECADPYVERLLEGVAFLTARVRMKLDDEFPHFTQSLLETIYPHYLCPTPSMTIVQFKPDPAEASLNEGVIIPRQSVLRSGGGIGDNTSCQYRTAHAVTLWPIEVVGANYYTREISSFNLPYAEKVSAGIRLHLKTVGGQLFSDTNLNSLTFYIRGGADLAGRLYESIFAHAEAIILRPIGTHASWQVQLPLSCLKQVGFSNEESLLPYDARSFHGYRLLHEYFAFPSRFLFFQLDDLEDSVGELLASEFEIFILLRQGDPRLEPDVSAKNFQLHCTPAINLFPMEPDRIHVSDEHFEFHVVPDRTRPLDFEVYQVQGVVGYGTRTEDLQYFEPFYSARGFESRGNAYYATYRVPRVLSEREINHGPRSAYAGSEVYITVLDEDAAPFHPDLRQLALQALCTNRDLPTLLQTGVDDSDFTLDISAPVLTTRVLTGPTAPAPSHAEGSYTWRIINHLSLNYLSLVDTAGGDAASALRELLSLYGDMAEPGVRKQINGIRTVGSRPITRRVFGGGQIAFARGLEISLTLENEALEGGGAFLLGAVLDRFFAKYVSLNSFTETVIRTQEQGEIKRWPARLGQRKLV